MMRKSTRIFGWAAVVAAVFVLQASSRPAAAEPMPKLDFAGSVTWLGQVPILVAIEKGFFRDEGLDVNVQVILSSSDRIRAVTAGSVAFSNLGRSTVISEMSRGNNSFFYFANVDDSPGSEGCWARAGFQSFPDLKGKKVAANTSAEVTMDGLLQNAGMSVRDVQFVNLSPNEMALALGRGDVDAACVWQPLLDNLKKAVPDGKLLGTDADTETYKRFGTMSSPDILIISRKLVEEHPDQARRLAVAIMRGADYVNQNPEAAAAAVAPLFRQPTDVVLAGIKNFKYYGSKGWREHMNRHTEQMQFLSSWLHRNKKIESAPDVKQWENTSFVPEL
ncbi:ABC transporter substrate-binding protein [Bradyrhizobium nitroreducens]|uniref:ABC transporter substrate-binding protein n=2 Tax=Bradyrhizobium nitroreducens TaxID=709803 RepID=A0A2M6UBM5_9BRAD|nr:ABC transporter substrate-binding protein [Bradyrhizobium nitroreducens]